MASEFPKNLKWYLLETYSTIQYCNLIPCDVFVFKNRLPCVKLTKKNTPQKIAAGRGWTWQVPTVSGDVQYIPVPQMTLDLLFGSEEHRTNGF